MNSDAQDVRDWWRTSIIDMRPGVIGFRGYPIQDLIGNVSLPAMIWLMVAGRLPNDAEAELLDAALVAGVDHGPQAPSIAAARSAVTCGLALNNAMASAVNMLGDVHGGAGQQTLELYYNIAARQDAGASLEDATAAAVTDWQQTRTKFIPGFGHRFHKDGDPRAPRLLELVRNVAARGGVSGRFADIGEAVERHLGAGRSRPVPMNIDGATAVIFAELGCEPPLARGLFCLSRSVGILAHAWEQTQQGGRNKGPVPPRFLYTYDGPASGERTVGSEGA
ncbi:citryl-CoA lyase [uncultured Paracoccus sp.]|uniref:citryl-CoA lyase n=1 Tax=uncultured Paracoccus sp. TaxID=189685 RepID=UPI00260516AB|nr:citryl-CoA lyase [uncultured Paracoccus sp.]